MAGSSEKLLKTGAAAWERYRWTQKHTPLAVAAGLAFAALFAIGMLSVGGWLARVLVLAALLCGVISQYAAQDYRAWLASRIFAYGAMVAATAALAAYAMGF